MASRSSGAADVPVGDVIKNIARRSTRFPDRLPDESYIEKMRQMAGRPLSEQILDEVSDSADICSDGEVIETNRARGRVSFRRRSSRTSAISKAIKNSEEITTSPSVEDVDSRLTGHFTPGNCDIAKVRPVILQNHHEQRGRANNGDVKTLNARLSLQSKLMEQLMGKIDSLESRTRSTIVSRKQSDESKEK